MCLFSLTNIIPRGILSFPNLQEVVVFNCRSLATLFPLSLARNLGKLKTLEIQLCDKLVEIVGKEDVTEHGTTEMFEFPYLRNLLLYELSLLSCFYPGKHHLECPVLKCLHVCYCPKLKLFTSEIHNNHKEAVTEAPISRLQQQPLFSVDKVTKHYQLNFLCFLFLLISYYIFLILTTTVHFPPFWINFSCSILW